MARRRFDPVELEILWTRLISIVDEAAATFVRASFSTLVREANDFAVVLTDAQGRSLAQSSMSIPSFIGSLPATVKHFLERYPLATLEPGDVIISNDPWMGTGHIHDLNMVMPIFRRGKVVAFAAVVSHLPDIGGRLRNSGIREIYEEGLQIPPLKLLHAGKPDAALLAMIAQNVRVPEQGLGDIWAQVAACRMLEERLLALLEHADLDAVGAEIRRRSERAMRSAIAALPDGDYVSRVEHDGFEQRIVIQCRLSVRGERLHIDYAGTSPQLPRAVNVVPIYTFAYSAYPIKALLSPDVPNNEGAFLPITTSAPAGSILNPRYPAASGARGMIGHMLTPAIMLALAQAIPERVHAPGSANSSVTMSGEHRGRRYAMVNFLNAGQGGSARRDGASVLSFPSNLGNSPIEVIEQLAPVTVRQRAIRRGSGGAGKHRGGDGCVFEFEMRADTPGVVSFIVTRLKVPPPGLFGGESGKPARLKLNGKPIDPSDHWVLKAGDRVVMETAGGGGYGAAGR
ncbi:MAG TPA: hydantoinase B/oxoprolinase family protein [Burkholderiales bacterium]|nr:hydantoinase B/oxoprolinase family protein [Burkholderiales bacterium]